MKAFKVLAGLLASFLSVSNAYSKVIHDGNCDYLIRDGKVIGSLCTQAPAPLIPQINNRIDSMLDIQGIINKNKLRYSYSGFRTSTLIKAIISVENPQVEPQAVSHAGAVGLMQILPTTAGMSEESLKHSGTNVLRGMKHLDAIYEKHRTKYGKDAIKFSLAEYLIGERNLSGAIDYYGISSWKDLENVIMDGDNPIWESGMRLKDSNGTDVVDYAHRILKNYFKFREIERKNLAKQ